MNELIEQIFQDFKVNDVSIPVSFLRYGGKSTTYITYMEWDKSNSYSGDDEILGYVSYYDFDIYSKGNYLAIVEAVKDTSILDMIEPKFKIGDKVKNYYDRSLPQIVIKAIDNTRYYGDTANFDIAEQNQWGIVRSCDNCKCCYYLGKRSDCDSTFVSCYLHKDCGGDEPIIIDECDFIETAMTCQEFEENK